MYCPGCGREPIEGEVFCPQCGRRLRGGEAPERQVISYPMDQLVLAGPGRRLAGFLLEMVLIVLTLGAGWVIWSALVYGRGQTPAKQILGMYVMREDGTRSGGWYTCMREWLIKGATGFLLGGLTFGIGQFVGAAWCIWDDKRQTVWDKVGATYVAWSPNGFRPKTAKELGLPPSPSPLTDSGAR